jgi:hypothetical protein
MVSNKVLIVKPFLVWSLLIHNQSPMCLRKRKYHSKKHLLEIFIVQERIFILLILLLIIFLYHGLFNGLILQEATHYPIQINSIDPNPF